MPAIFKIIFALAPLAAQFVLDASQAAGVNHQTVATRIASWVLAGIVSARAVLPASMKEISKTDNVTSNGA